MPGKPLKSRTVAVKVEEELAEFLARLPNKSEFIRQAILAQFGAECPLCSGAGQVAAGIGAHYGPIVERNRRKTCGRCAKLEDIPNDVLGLPERDRPRWERFLHGGPFYCAECFEHEAVGSAADSSRSSS